MSEFGQASTLHSSSEGEIPASTESLPVSGLRRMTTAFVSRFRDKTHTSNFMASARQPSYSLSASLFTGSATCFGQASPETFSAEQGSTNAFVTSSAGFRASSKGLGTATDTYKLRRRITLQATSSNQESQIPHPVGLTQPSFEFKQSNVGQTDSEFATTGIGISGSFDSGSLRKNSFSAQELLGPDMKLGFGQMSTNDGKVSAFLEAGSGFKLKSGFIQMPQADSRFGQSSGSKPSSAGSIKRLGLGHTTGFNQINLGFMQKNTGLSRKIESLPNTNVASNLSRVVHTRGANSQITMDPYLKSFLTVAPTLLVEELPAGALEFFTNCELEMAKLDSTMKEVRGLMSELEAELFGLNDQIPKVTSRVIDVEYFIQSDAEHLIQAERSCSHDALISIHSLLHSLRHNVVHPTILTESFIKEKIASAFERAQIATKALELAGSNLSPLGELWKAATGEIHFTENIFLDLETLNRFLLLQMCQTADRAGTALARAQLLPRDIDLHHCTPCPNPSLMDIYKAKDFNFYSTLFDISTQDLQP